MVLSLNPSVKLIQAYLAILMLIGVVICQQESEHQAIYSNCVVELFHGKQRNNQLLPYHQLRQST